MPSIFAGFGAAILPWYTGSFQHSTALDLDDLIEKTVSAQQTKFGRTRDAESCQDKGPVLIEPRLNVVAVRFPAAQRNCQTN